MSLRILNRSCNRGGFAGNQFKQTKSIPPGTEIKKKTQLVLC
jgi:hypothetical protein